MYKTINTKFNLWDKVIALHDKELLTVSKIQISFTDKDTYIFYWFKETINMYSESNLIKHKNTDNLPFTGRTCPFPNPTQTK